MASTLRAGTDAETDAALADRIITRRRERPGSGNRADWRDWTLGYTESEVSEVYVYPLLAPPTSWPGAGTVATPGTVTVVAVGPAQGDSVTNTRIVPTDGASSRTAGAHLTRIEDFIEGDRLPDGTDVSANPNDALRPATLGPGNYAIEAINIVAQAVLMTVEVTYANIVQWVGSLTVVSATTTSLVVSGDHTDKDGFRMLVNVTTARYRGGYKLYTVWSGVFDGVNTTFVVVDDSGDIAHATGTVYPGVGNFNAIRTAALAYFDALGPGDTSPTYRWPDQDDGGRAKLYRTALAAAVIGADGVLSATTTTPATDVTPAAKHVVTLDTFRVTT